MADGSSDSGFGSAIAAPENRHLEIYWHGPVPAAVEAVIDRERSSVPIVVKPARHSERQLLHALNGLAKRSELIEVGPSPDAGGLVIRMRKGQPVTASVRSAIADAGVSTSVSDAAGDPVLFSRQDDSSPWYAGARNIFSSTQPSGGGCTTGFAVNHGGRTKLLSAAHCGNDGAPFYDGAGQFIGYAQSGNTGKDVQLIDARGAGRMWDGGVNSTYSKPVQGASQSVAGNWLCTSGSRSGVRCGIQAKAVNQSYGGAYPLVRAERTDGTSAAGTRDSGGPVFSLPSPDNGKVIAKGIISRGDPNTTVGCVGENFSGRICTWRFYYADVSQTLVHYGASIVTG
ncbi:hypothetical protein [Micromonospora sp. NPDC126480]|uniref:hypothetical protein n=1 Tax=Micromonospora sp. NPDC126480 TaxID=3155312 RepID=UPI0033290479